MNVPLIEPGSVVPGWGMNPGEPALGLISAVATSADGMVFVLCRAPRPVMRVFHADGSSAGTWAFPFVQPHGLWIGPDSRVFTTDLGDHTVRIFDISGNLLQTIGTPGTPGAAGMPFNAPTRAMPSPSGDIYVSDGYGQNRVHRFTAEGKIVHSWGSDGAGPGQFDTPHSLWVDAEERVYVVDRANSRVQVFDGEGNVLDVWSGFCWPHDIFMTAGGHLLITDCAPRDDTSRPYHEIMPSRPIHVFTTDGERLTQTGLAGTRPGEFLDCPHALWIDPAGDLYASEVVTPDRLQKFHGVLRTA